MSAIEVFAEYRTEIPGKVIRLRVTPGTELVPQDYHFAGREIGEQIAINQERLRRVFLIPQKSNPLIDGVETRELAKGIRDSGLNIEIILAEGGKTERYKG